MTTRESIEHGGWYASAEGAPSGGSAQRPRTLHRYGVAIAALTLASMVSIFVAVAQTSPPDLQPVSLSNVPLLAATQGDKPSMVLALSVEYPTVGAQYTPPGTDPTNPILLDRSYSNTTEYIGYYDAGSCYAYNNAPSETPPAGMVAQDLKRFDRTGPATNRMCANGFSGNFLNWASSSAVDMMRMALSGGDRYVDTETLTILQRAVLPDGAYGPVPCFFNSRNFPGKKLDRNGGGSSKYFGAIPASMRIDAAGKDVWVGNILNRIYFGAFASDPRTQDCTARSLYTLGAGKPAPTPESNGAGPAVIQPPGTPLPPPNYASANGPYSAPPPISEAQCTDGTSNCPVPWNATSQQVYEVWYGSGVNWSVAIVKQWFNCDGATFGNPGGGGANGCYLRIPAAGAAAWPPPGVPGLNSEGYFFARVKVCDTEADGTLADSRDYALCAKYPSGKHKPVGAIQRYADRVRLAAFGYVMDQTQPEVDAQSSFGGVLRAPMKYLGDKVFDEAGNELAGINPAREWDPATGVFAMNPDAHAAGISGVVNYLNRFGRTNPSAPGRYKIFDPVSELHYEALRYLQGKQPSALAVNRLKADPSKADGFPAYTTWADPFGGNRDETSDYSCLKSSLVVVGDINTNDPSATRFNLSTVDGAPNGTTVPDITSWNGWRGVALAFEANDATMSYLDGSGQRRQVGRTPTALDPVNTSARYVPLVGTAYWAHSHDVRPTGSTKARPGLRVRSMFFDVNEWGQSAGASKATFRRTANQFFTAAKYGGYETDPLLGNTWGNPFKRENGEDSENVWQRTDSPGEAKTYYLAEDARKVLTAFDDIFKTASTAARSIAGGAVSSRELTTAGGYVYQGAFNTEDWSGDVLAFRLTADNSGSVQVSSTPTWQASARLNAMPDPVSDRKIFVGQAGATPAVPFVWSSIDQALRSDLSRASPSAAADSLGPERLAYLRGDRSKEGTVFRPRSTLLGDVVNSGVAYLGAPSGGLLADPGYAGFYKTEAGRTPAVFAGANDGMLHAFDANTGDELFAYIPSWMGPKLSALAEPGYRKQAYVDSTPAVGEARVNGSWGSVLISGTGGGGRGVFALDVTHATQFGSANVLWEFTSADDPDLGYVVGKPQIVKLRTNSPSEATPVYGWFAMVASGVNNYVPDASGANFSTTGQPALFLLSLDKRPSQAWCAPTSATSCGPYTYYKVSWKDIPTNGRTATGMVNFRPVFGADRQVVAVYAGDLQGNLWKLDFSRQGSASWDLAGLSAFKTTSGEPIPLFIARDAAGARQPITMAPSVAAGARLGGGQTAYVAFGTGKYLEVSDVTSASQNSFYVVLDPGVNQVDSPSPQSAISGRGRLAQGTASAGSVIVPAFTWGLPGDDSDISLRAGYFFDFPATGERSISNAVIVGDSLVFGSLNPRAGDAQPCGPRRGGNQYTLNLDSGNGVLTSSDVGLLGEPLVVENASAVTYRKSDTTGRRTKTVVSQVLQQGSSGLSPSSRLTSTVIAGRLSWRQIHNYQEARTAW